MVQCNYSVIRLANELATYYKCKRNYDKAYFCSHGVCRNGDDAEEGKGFISSSSSKCDTCFLSLSKNVLYFLKTDIRVPFLPDLQE